MFPKFRHKLEASPPMAWKKPIDMLGNRWRKWDQDRSGLTPGENSLRQPPFLGHSRKPSLDQCSSSTLVFLDHDEIWAPEKKWTQEVDPKALIPRFHSRLGFQMRWPWRGRICDQPISNRTVGMSPVALWVGKVVNLKAYLYHLCRQNPTESWNSKQIMIIPQLELWEFRNKPSLGYCNSPHECIIQLVLRSFMVRTLPTMTCGNHWSGHLLGCTMGSIDDGQAGRWLFFSFFSLSRTRQLDWWWYFNL